MNASLLARPPPDSQAPVAAPPASTSANANAGSVRTKSFVPRDNASTAPRKGPEVTGWTEPVDATRQCSVGSCANPPEWPWRRCRSCRAAGTVQKSVVVSCASCRASVSVHTTVAKSGQPVRCISCHTKGPAGKRIDMKERPPLTTMGPPPPKQLNELKRKVPAQGPLAEHGPQSILEAAAAFVHPDHLHVLRLPETMRQSLQSAPRLNHALLHMHTPVSTLGSAHYGPHGEILAVTPGRMRVPYDDQSRIRPPELPVVAGSFVPPQSGRTPAESIVIYDPNNMHNEAAEKGSLQRRATLTNDNVVKRRVTLKLPSGSSEVDGVEETTPLLKRKRQSSSSNHAPMAERVCISSGCGRQIPPNTKGEFCADCGFILWRKQFRARVVGLSASISGDGGPADNEQSKSSSTSPAAGGAVHPRDRGVVRDLLDEVMDADEEDVPLAVALARKRASVTSDKAPSPGLAAALPSPARTAAQSQPVITTTPELASQHSPPPSTNPAPPLSAPSSADAPDDKGAVLKSPLSGPPSDLLPEACGHASESKDVLSPDGLAPQSPVPTASPLPPQHLRLEPPPSSPSPLPAERPILKIRIKVPKHLRRRRRKSSLEWQLGWDSDLSDLTPLEESTDEGESEVDPSDSESESDDEPLANRIKTKSELQIEAEDNGVTAALAAPVKHRSVCTAVSCANLVPEESRRRECNFCRARKRSAKRRLQLQRLIAEDTIEEIKMPLDGDLTGYRRCTRGFCKRMIPPETEYRFKRCPQCRSEMRNRARVMRAKPSGLSEDEEGDDTPLFAASSARSQVNLCKDTGVDSRTLHHDGRQLPDVPAYQHFAALLAALHDRFSEFKLAQRRYLQFKAHQERSRAVESKPPPRAIVFRFDGEYSVVADPSGGVVDPLVQVVWRNVQAALGLPFTAVGVNAGPENSVVAILRCVYATQVPLPASAVSSSESPAGVYPPAPTTDAESRKESDPSALVKMVGELQICVAWDRRHKYFPGQRILVRFRLVG
ncbi:hypothetical protein PYCCODRAFT_1477852 [Trametes coccinea BRFM310]|uniref:Uncharacterized protein n=1 Tax=Trametes coccinea (strain BRFM310) TaxID=1353009 RepID=A0A1Y2IMF4_TRAC3|nr:hypothetical protein PYCCODRAFT_1477852 [Trametes coccinea BRFM310]